MPSSVVRCSVLGQTEIYTQGIRLTPESERQFGLTLYYCANAGRDVSRDDVARLFWPEHEGDAARHCLRQALYRLRALGVPVRSGAKATSLDPRCVEADYASVVAEGASSSAYSSLGDVAVLPGYAPRFSAPFARWVDEFRGEIGARVRRGLVRAIAEMRARGRYQDVERLARQCLTLDPLNEEATLALAEAIALAGGKVEALKMIARYATEVGPHSPHLGLTSRVLEARISDVLGGPPPASGELPLIGRGPDVERVVRSLQRLKSGEGLSFVVWGAAGVGKSRLCRECCRIAGLQGIRVVSVAAQPSYRSQTLATISDLVARLLALPGALGCSPAALASLRGIAVGGNDDVANQILPPDSGTRFGVVRWSVLDLLDSLVEEGPLLIHVDDAQYVDPSSSLILQDAVRSFLNRPVALLFSLREPPTNADAEGLREIVDKSVLHRLESLSEDAGRELIDRYCSALDDAIEPGSRERIVRLSGGNPFFLLELLRHQRDLSSSEELPPSIQSILQQRLVLLSSSALRVLQASAVLGPLATLDRIEKIVELGNNDMLSALEELERAGLLATNESGLMCRHELLREAVVRSTANSVLQVLHQLAARTLSREVMRTQTVSHLWQCVHHWRLAGIPVRGVGVATRLSRRLLSLGLPNEALRILDELEPFCTSSKDLDRVLRGVTMAGRMLRDWSRIVAAADRRRLLGDDASKANGHSAFELFEYEARCYLPAGWPDFWDRIQECVSCEEATIQHRLDAAVLALMHADNDARAEIADKVFAAAANVTPNSRRAAIARVTCDMIYHASFGDITRAEEAADDLLLLTQGHAHPVTRAVMLRRAARTYVRGGKLQIAGDLCLEALAIARKVGLLTEAVPSLELLAEMSLDLGDYDRGTRFVKEARDLAAEAPTVYSRAVAFSTEVRLAFESQNALAISKTARGMLHVDPPFRTRRSLQLFYVSLAATRICLGEVEPLRRIVSELEELHKWCAGLGQQDYPVSVLVHALVMLGRNEDAIKVLRGYICDSRRDLGPYPPALLRLCVALAVAPMRPRPPFVQGPELERT